MEVRRQVGALGDSMRRLLLHAYLLPIAPVLVPGKPWRQLAGTGSWPCRGELGPAAAGSAQGLTAKVHSSRVGFEAAGSEEGDRGAHSIPAASWQGKCLGRGMERSHSCCCFRGASALPTDDFGRSSQGPYSHAESQLRSCTTASVPRSYPAPCSSHPAQPHFPVSSGTFLHRPIQEGLEL